MANNLIINRLFTLAAFQKLIDGTDSRVYSEIVNSYVDKSAVHTNGEAIAVIPPHHSLIFSDKGLQSLINLIYKFMKKEYRNQYYYKNTILNRLLLGVHSINTTTALTEIPISTSKADFVLINGKAVVYEIKTELDNLERLESQINNYYKAFNHVCVLTCDEYASILLEKLANTKVGIYVLTERDYIRRLKEPEKFDDLLNQEEIFRVLNKPEFEEIIKQYYGKLPTATQVKYYSKCKELFSEIPLQKAYSLFLKQLKSRNTVTDKNSFKKVPYEIKSLAYFSQYKDIDYSNLEHFLSSNIGG